MAAKIGILDLPVEIRCVIYDYLLVLHEPLAFIFDQPSQKALLPRYLKSRLHHAILLVNRQCFLEGCSRLYSHNQFQFPRIESWPPGTEQTHITSILTQMGTRTSLIRHVGLDFPHFTFDWGETNDQVKLD